MTVTPAVSSTSPTITVTAFVTTTVQTSGVSAATTGGIAGGIAGGFLLLGALAFIYITRGTHRRGVASSGEGGGGELSIFPQHAKPQEEVGQTQLRYPDYDENIESGRTREIM